VEFIVSYPVVEKGCYVFSNIGLSSRDGVTLILLLDPLYSPL